MHTSIKSEIGGESMGRAAKKKNKVPTITEAEYEAYLATLKNEPSIEKNTEQP